VETITRRHHEVHEGKAFHIADVQNVNSTTMQWMITTPAAPTEVHLITSVEATGEVSAELLEASDKDGTTALVPVNRKRNGSAAATTVHRGATGGTTDGDATQPLVRHRGGATGVGGHTLTGGGTPGSNEHILKPDTKYMMTVETFANVWVSVDLDWYEHIDEEA
jgi:hypothetical protein